MQIIRMFQSNDSLFFMTIAFAIFVSHALPTSAVDSMRDEAQPPLPSSIPLNSGALNRLILSRLESMESHNDDSKDGVDLVRKFSDKGMNDKMNGEFDAPQTQREQLKQQQKQGYLQVNKQKVALKKKWHKLVDDLIDGEFSSDSYAPAKSHGQKRDSFKIKKWMPDVQDDGKNVVIIMKKPPNYADDNSEDGGGNPNSGSMNTVNLWDIGRDSRREESISNRRPVNMSEHAKKVLDDGFGVMRESKFTTNNHLGLKGVPKFGSEEEY